MLVLSTASCIGSPVGRFKSVEVMTVTDDGEVGFVSANTSGHVPMSADPKPPSEKVLCDNVTPRSVGGFVVIDPNRIGDDGL